MKLLKIIGNLLLAVLVITAGLFAAGHFGWISFYKPFVVLSGSMEPSISTGSIVLVQPRQFGYMEGDIITYMTSAKGTPTTHRIQELVYQDQELMYKTKGDANSNLDAGLVDPRNVIGRVHFFVPYLGYAAKFAGTPQGFIALVIIPSTILIYEEVKNIWNELMRMVRKKKKLNDPDQKTLDTHTDKKLGPTPRETDLETTQTEDLDTEIKSFQFTSLLQSLPQTSPKISLTFIVISLGTLLIASQSFTTAVYADFEQTIANYFGAANEYDQSTVPIDLPEECAALYGKIFIKLEGTEEDDEIDGSENAELILGYGGNDDLDGGGGDDCIIGGAGDDEIEGRGGNDIIHGGAGEDDIDAGSGNDYVYGNEDNDTLDGDDGNDYVYGGLGNDEIEGGDGDDHLYGEEGNDDLDGSTGNDFLSGGIGNDVLSGGSGSDELEGNEGDDRIKGGSSNDSLDGGPDFDILDGDSGTDSCTNGEDLSSCEL